MLHAERRRPAQTGQLGRLYRRRRFLVALLMVARASGERRVGKKDEELLYERAAGTVYDAEKKRCRRMHTCEASGDNLYFGTSLLRAHIFMHAVASLLCHYTRF